MMKRKKNNDVQPWEVSALVYMWNNGNYSYAAMAYILGIEKMQIYNRLRHLRKRGLLKKYNYNCSVTAWNLKLKIGNAKTKATQNG